MTVQPAYEVTLERDGTTVMLRASLRAAVTIENMPGGIAGAYDGLLKQSYTAIRQVLLATATDQGEAINFLARMSGKPLSRFAHDAQAACLAVLAALLQPGDDDADQASSRGSNQSERMTLRQYFDALYGYATGWLGWSPAETWAASPAEISAAFTAHIDRLMKLTPGLSGGDDDLPKASTSTAAYSSARLQEIEELGHDPAFDREGLRALKAKFNA